MGQKMNFLRAFLINFTIPHIISSRSRPIRDHSKMSKRKREKVKERSLPKPTQDEERREELLLM